MVHVALLVRLEAKPGKEKDVEALLRSALPLANAEPATTVWFALKIGPSTFGIFDAFPDDAGRQAHLAGQIAAALMAKAPELLATPPTIEPVEVLAAKL
ncbi:MAG: antibiotic biosynthesis monooxygenase [Vicinamibacterales bacterium]